MKLNELETIAGSTKPKKRVGRGIGSGMGKTSTRGVKGQKARSGVAIKGYEGGQMPLYRRLPKRGFNVPSPKEYNVINLGRIQQAFDAKKLDSKADIDGDALVKAGVITRLKKDGVRILAKGELKKTTAKFIVAGASQSAQEAIQKAGGSIELTGAKENA